MAYLGSPTRVWQFGVGALLAVWLPLGGVSPCAPWLGLGDSAAASRGRILIPTPRGWVGWIGLAGIAGAITAFDGQTPYLGAVAVLPTLGTAAVITAGAGRATANPAGA